MQTNDILMLINDQFAFEKKNVIKSTKIMIKNRKMFIFQQLIKFNDVQIKFDSKNLLLIKKINVGDINLMINKNVLSINAKDIIRIELFFKNQYVAQQIRNAYMTSICQFETFYDLSRAIQFIDFLTMTS